MPLILIIDDDDNLLFGLLAVMRREGYQCISAANGKDGLKLAQERLPDLIISDVMMPPPNGFELRKQLSQNSKTIHIPFIFLTARTSQGDKIFGLESGADDYITKPFDRGELVARVHAVLRRNHVHLEDEK
ncbi:MAG: response regulator [Anaerolineaceae bacterium]|nr:response regulator [Anaerolineaceae bacterium]